MHYHSCLQIRFISSSHLFSLHSISLVCLLCYFLFSSHLRLFYTASNRRPCLRFCLVTVSCSYSLVVSWMTIRCHPSSVSVRHIFNSIHFQAAPPLLRTRWARSTSLWPDWTGPSRDWAPLTLRYSSYPPWHHITSHHIRTPSWLTSPNPSAAKSPHAVLFDNPRTRLRQFWQLHE